MTYFLLLNQNGGGFFISQCLKNVNFVTGMIRISIEILMSKVTDLCTQVFQCPQLAILAKTCGIPSLQNGPLIVSKSICVLSPDISLNSQTNVSSNSVMYYGSN